MKPGKKQGESFLLRRAYLYSLIVVVFVAFHGPSAWLAYFLQFPKEGVGGIPDVLFNAGIFVLWGGIHSLLSRRFTKKFMEGLVGEKFARSVSVIIMGITQCFLLYFWRPLQGTLWHTEGMAYWIFTILFLSSLGSMFHSSLLLDYMEVLGIRKILRYLKGEQDKPPIMVLRGPYRYCRHPVYLANIFFLWIGPIMTYGRLEFALLGSLYILIGGMLEEMTTRVELGEEYDKYRANVPMWIPRFTPWNGGDRDISTRT